MTSHASTSASGAYARLQSLAAPVPAPAPAPAGLYARFSVTGDLVHTSGVVGRHEGRIIPGPLHSANDVDLGEQAARAAVLQILYAAHEALGSLDRVDRVVSLQGYLCTSEGFVDHVRVMNAASALLQAVFPQAPLPVRTTVGVASLPGGGAVEVSMVLQLQPLP